MGRKPVDEMLKKTNLTISIPKWQVQKLKEIKGYNRVIERLLNAYFKSEVKNMSKKDER